LFSSLFSVVVGENVVEKLLLLKVETTALVFKKEEEEEDDEREHRRWFETTATLEEGAIISLFASRIRVEFYGEIVNVKRG